MKILLAISSSISSYKTPALVRLLKKDGHDVFCCLTKNASKLVSKKSLETVSENPVITNMWKDKDPLMHININKETDVMLIAPATANIIGKLAGGIADDTLTTIAAAYVGKKYIAPAMNTEMWNNNIVQKNIKILTDELNYVLIEPECGELACKDEGNGRLASLENIVNAVKSKSRYKNLSIGITSGSTKEWIDPIRYITNRSSGKMGYALYQAAVYEGAKCFYIEGGVEKKVYDKNKIKVETTKEMFEATVSIMPKIDILIMAAAPLDFKPASLSEKKIKKSDINKIELCVTDDIAKRCGEIKNKNQIVVAFAAESAKTKDELAVLAKEKLLRKKADMIVANTIEDGFGGDTDVITIFYSDGNKKSFDKMSKSECAKIIIEEALNLYIAKNGV